MISFFPRAGPACYHHDKLAEHYSPEHLVSPDCYSFDDGRGPHQLQHQGLVVAVPPEYHGPRLDRPRQHASLADDYPTRLLLSAELMQSETWGMAAPATPKAGRFSHQRESSLSSLGSAGPASPFAASTSTSTPHPQIAVTDSAVDGFADMHPHEASGAQGHSFYQFAKPISAYAGHHNVDGAMPEMAYPVTIPGPGKKPRPDRGLLPAPGLAGGPGRSRPASVASSVAGDSPATPTLGDSDQVDERRNDYGSVPKLDRTMTDVYGDELYSPNFAITSASPSQPLMAASSGSDVFSQRINAANSHHLSAAHPPASTASRTTSPFRTGSPFAPSPNRGMGTCHGSFAFHSAQRMRESGKSRPGVPPPPPPQAGEGMGADSPKTISPKDAVLEFNEGDRDGSFSSLFPQDATDFGMDNANAAMGSVVATEPEDAFLVSGSSHGSDGCAAAPFLACQMAADVQVQVPQHYPFVAATHESPRDTADDAPRRRRRISSAASSSAGGGTPRSPGRPSGTSAEGGTYTCTYHGCTLRFETPSLLQRHKREGHRQTQGLGAPREASMTLSLLNTQAGPHRCDRINPSTGKPCTTMFSRPYDLTRHEDTIHNARKQKVRCDLCTEEKTFSRADALTRHYRVCHPDVELPSKHRRRAGA